MNPALPPEFARAYLAKHGKRIQQSGEQRARKRSGDETEEFVETLHQECLDRGIAFVRKLPTPFRVVRSLGKGKLLCVPEKKSGADYVGHMLDGSGRGVFAEVKRCTDRSFPLSRIEEHQREELDRAHEAGVVALVVIVYGPTLARADLFPVPWNVVRDAIARDGSRRGDKSLSPEDLAPHLAWRDAPYLARFARMTS
jgi:penicillin-binding protein-related factor A (putative recombinase)